MTAAVHAPAHSVDRDTLGDALLPRWVSAGAPAWVRDLLLVVGGTVLLVLGAYLTVTVPAVQLGGLYVPVNEYVPLTLQTFGVLFSAALLGARRGVSATALYLLLGIVGLPVFAAGADGVHRSGLDTIVGLEAGHIVLGTTGGYLVGFLVASAVVGRLAERGWDRRPTRSLTAMAIGMALIYLCGVSWLAIAAGLSLSDALVFGLWPFVPGDLAKLAAAAALLPLGWRAVSGRVSETHGGTSGPA